MRQGDSLSPILFAIFINDLATEMNSLDAGIWIGGDKLSLLMYADDIVLLSENTTQTQSQLDVMSQWCSQWGMAINAKKSQIVHVRHHQKRRESKKLFCCGQELQYVKTYKYLDYYIHEHLKHTQTTEILTGSAKRAISKIINMFKHLRNMGYKTYTTLYNSNILSIANYVGGVWGFKNITTHEYYRTK